MKKLTMSITAAIVLTAVILLIIWNLPKYEKNKSKNDTFSSADTSLSELSGLSSVNDTEEYSSETSTHFSEESSAVFETEYGALFSSCKDIIDAEVYKLVMVRQKRFGGNSVPVTTTTYYGDGFVNVVVQEGHSLASEMLINADGTYLFDSSANYVYLLKNYETSTDKLITEGIRFTGSGEISVGTVLYNYESYDTVDNGRIDYLFLGGSLKRIKLYNDEGDYEIIGVELSGDISGARSSLPEDALIVETKY